MELFSGRTLVIATRHGKEQVIAPLLEAALGVTCLVPPDLDTDQLGTFSGEVERPDGPLPVARTKCRLAMEATGTDLAVASEGSFGPHPQLFFLPSDEEILVFMDARNDLEVHARHVDTATNYAGSIVRSLSDLRDFAQQAEFPRHALILRKGKDDLADMVKGITSYEQLEAAFNRLLTTYGEVYVETDMRAMYNPTRMEVIGRTAEKLVNRIRSCCPACSWPGFGVTEQVAGLPCAWCGQPTRSTRLALSSCRRCHHQEEHWFPLGREEEDPGQCDACNP